MQEIIGLLIVFLIFLISWISGCIIGGTETGSGEIKDPEPSIDSKLTREYSRYLLVNDIRRKSTGIKWNNLLYIFLINISMIRGSNKKDPVFFSEKSEELDKVYDRFSEDIIESGINIEGGVQNLVSNIKKDIASFLMSPEASDWKNYIPKISETVKSRMLKLLKSNNSGDLDPEKLLILLQIRYESILFRQLNIPISWYRCLMEDYKVELDLFSPPHYSKLLLLQDIKYFGLFPDIDKYFGSSGYVLDFDLLKYMKESGKKEIGINIMLSYSELLSEKIVDMILSWLDSDYRIRFFISSPGYFNAGYFKKLNTSKYKTGYFESRSHNLYFGGDPKIYARSNFIEFILMNYTPDTELSYDKAFERMLNIEKLDFE